MAGQQGWKKLSYSGSWERSLDEKGRLVLPPALRGDYQAGVHISRSPIDPCLMLYSETEHNAALKRLDKRIQKGKESRHTLRRWSASVVPVNMDSQGRVPLPQKLRDSLGIQDKDKVMVVGVGRATEVWTLSEWSNVESSDEGFGDGAWL